MITWGELIGIVFILAAAGLFYFIMSKARRIRSQQDRILDEELQKVTRELDGLKQLITPSLLEQYGFKIYDTKDVTYALKGSISMTQKDGYWETEIQAPGRILWRDTHMYIGQLEHFCKKHDLEITKQEDND